MTAERPDELVAAIDDHFHCSLDAWADDPRALLLQRARDRIAELEQAARRIPREPTPKMLVAGFKVSEAEHDPGGVWRAMYDAAMREGEK